MSTKTTKEAWQDSSLDELVRVGDIDSYEFTNITNHGNFPPYQTMVINFKSGNKLVIHSWSTPTPESSGLITEFIDKSTKLV